eukprot:Pgem_evm1s19605
MIVQVKSNQQDHCLCCCSNCKASCKDAGNCVVCSDCEHHCVWCHHKKVYSHPFLLFFLLFILFLFSFLSKMENYNGNVLVSKERNRVFDYVYFYLDKAFDFLLTHKTVFEISLQCQNFTQQAQYFT